MKKVLFIAACLMAVSLFFQCGADNSRRDATSTGKFGWIFEGWACAPDSAKALEGQTPAQYCKDDPKKDYLYMKFSAAASQVAIDSGRLAQMMATCREAARLQVAGDGLAKIIGEFIEKASGVSNGQSTGVAIVSQTKGKISGIGVYDCCSIDNDTGACTVQGKKEDWSQCMCVGYLKFPGGQKSFETMAKEASAGQ